jgi:NAD+--dinitrogen-reductase ADP-D-ribosyltransferase
VAGVREATRALFALLARCAERGRGARVFAHYMRLAFAGPAAGRAPKTPGAGDVSYLKLLQGWGLDANGAAGAVLKGWVESRFGLVPAFHKAPLGRFPSPAWVAYLRREGRPALPQQPDLPAAGPAVRVLPVDAGSASPAGPGPST